MKAIITAKSLFSRNNKAVLRWHSMGGLSDKIMGMVVLSSFFLLLMVDMAMAVPACPAGAEVVQPDGTAITVFLRGDEHAHWNESEDGYLITKDEKTGVWSYVTKTATTAALSAVGTSNPQAIGAVKPDIAKLSSLATQIQQQQLPAQGAPALTSTTGTMYNLVVLVSFSDLAVAYPQQSYDDLFNQVGYTTDGAVGSVKDYYHQISYNGLTVQSTVVEAVTLDNGYAYYGANDGNGDDIRPREMVQQALAKLEARGFDFGTMDGDSDGWIDGLTIIHAGGGEEYSGNDSSYIWSHMWALSSPVTYDGTSMQIYHTEPARRGWDSSPSTQGITRIGVICHENGHFLGLPDLYDYGYDSKGAGNFCLMAGGSWNGSYGTTPAHMSAWCKSAMGWVTPSVLSTGGFYTLGQVETNAQVYKLQGTFPSTQYFLIENRQGVGFDTGLPGSQRGVLIWHVDEIQANNNDQTHYKVDLEEASGVQHLELNQNAGDDADYFRLGNATAFTDSTVPNSRSYSSQALGIDITNISAVGSTMSFVCDDGSPQLPVAQNGSVAAQMDTSVPITMVATDDGLPGALTYIITSLPTNGTLSDPGNGIISSVPYSLVGNGNQVVYSPDSGYLGPDTFGFKANDGGTPPDGGDSNIATISINVVSSVTITIGTGTSTWEYPMHTYWHDSRTQVIYLASEIGVSGTILDLALDVGTVPGQTMNNWTIRMKHTSLSSYSPASFDASDWVVVYQGNEPAGVTGWRTFALSTTFDYNGTDNLLIDFSHNNSSWTTNGMCRYSASGTIRSAYAYTDSDYGDPLTWSGTTSPTVNASTCVPNVKLTIGVGVGFVLDPPILHAEPNMTAGMSNTISWDPVVNAGQYYADCAIDANFSNVVASSGWISETNYEFGSLIPGQKYWYSVKARTDAEAAWLQTAQMEFNTDVLTSVSTAAVPGDVVLMGSGGSILFQDDFEDGDMGGWVNGSGIYTREVTATTAAAGSTYSLTLTGGADSHFDGVSHDLSSITPDSITFYVRSGSTTNANGYFVVGTGTDISTETAVFFYTYDGFLGVYDGVVSWETSCVSSTWYKIRFAFDWAAKEIDFYVNDGLVGSNITFRGTGVSSLTKLYLYNFSNSQAWWDEIEFSDSSGGSGGYALSGSIVSTTIDLPVGGSWGEVSFNKTTPAGTSLTVDVLDASDDSVILSNVASGVDISSIAATTSIKLCGNLSTSDTAVTPALHDWAVTYTDAAGATESEWSNIEFSQQVVLGDLEPDGDVDVDDLAIMAEDWLDSTGMVEADLNGDNVVNFKDYAIFSTNGLVVIY